TDGLHSTITATQLLHRREANTLDQSTLDLTMHSCGIEDRTDIVGTRKGIDGERTRFAIHGYFRHEGGKTGRIRQLPCIKPRLCDERLSRLNHPRDNRP